MGNSLHGGEEKVEEVRVGLLGFGKEVDALRRVVETREKEVGELVEERRDVRTKIEFGRRLVDYEARLGELEDELDIDKAATGGGDVLEDSDEEEDDDEDEEGSFGVSIVKLRRNVMQYRLIQELAKSLGEHPLITAQLPRMTKVRSTLLLDLQTALKQAKSAGSAGSTRMLKVMKVYASMEESAEAVKALNSLKAT